MHGTVHAVQRDAQCPSNVSDRCAVDCEGWTALIVAKKTAEDVQFKNQNGKVEESTWSKIYDLLEVEGS